MDDINASKEKNSYLSTTRLPLVFLLTIAALSVYLLIYFQRSKSRAVDLMNKCVLITGGGLGIGREMALKFAEEGSYVILWDINKDSIDKVAGEIDAIHENKYSTSRNKNISTNNNDNNNNSSSNCDNANIKEEKRVKSRHAKHLTSEFVFCVQCDVSSRDSVSKAAKLSKAYLQDAKTSNDNLSGFIDVLVNNAGVVSGKLFKDLTSRDIERTHGVNYFGNVWTLQEILPDMIERKSGHVVTISSLMGLLPGAGLTDYCASKFATVGMAQCLRLEMKKLTNGAVSTSLICPYAINTGMFDGIKINYEWLFPLLQPKFVAQKVVDAVKFKDEMVILPWTVAIVVKFLPLMPSFVRDIIYAQCGAINGMDHFKGRAAASTPTTTTTTDTNANATASATATTATSREGRARSTTPARKS